MTDENKPAEVVEKPTEVVAETKPVEVIEVKPADVVAKPAEVVAEAKPAEVAPPVEAAKPPEVTSVEAKPLEVATSAAEATFMPAPADVPGGNPEDPASAPGAVPAGDSRSLRLGPTFALVYRRGTAVITRSGAVGTRGQWRVVEYPTPSSASNAYAKECSRFVGEGFSDYRD